VAPYPAFGVVSWRGDVGNSTFEALQLNLRRAFHNGFLLSSNYVWSHSINDGSIGGGDSDTPQNSFCRSCDKASSDFDIRQLFNLSAVYALPFGAGKQYLSSPGIIRTLLGNWEVSAIGTAQTGIPMSITIARSNGSVPGLYAVSGSERPDYVPGQSLTPAGGSTRITGLTQRHPQSQPMEHSVILDGTYFAHVALRNSISASPSSCRLKSA
jgi:hypothetical protein